jgi:hypothetical protein
MDEHKHLPSLNQLSILTSTILLGYSLTPFIKFPVQDIRINFILGTFNFRFEFLTLVSILVGLLGGMGMDSLLRRHPHYQGGIKLQHLILPALTASALGIPINSFRIGATWWLLFGFGGALLVLVFIAEYIVMDFSDLRFPLASIGLSALSFGLLLILAISLRSSALRLYLMVPSIVVPATLVSMRTLFLRMTGRWLFAWGAAIALVLFQITTGLQYLPLSPIGYGLVVVASVYALTSLVGSLEESRSFRTAIIEPGIILTVVALVIIAIGG